MLVSAIYSLASKTKFNNFMESYRSGHNEAVLKTVWVQAHGGSNPSLSANKIRHLLMSFFVAKNRRGIRIRRKFACKFPFRVNSPVDCLSGGSREANPSLSATENLNQKIGIGFFVCSK